MLAGNLAHGLEEAELKRDRLLADQRCRLHHFLGGLKFALGVNDLRAPLTLGLGLFGHRPFHAVGQGHVLHFHGGNFDAPRLGLAVDNFLQLLIDHITLGE